MTAQIKSVERAVIDCTYNGSRSRSGSGEPESLNIEHVGAIGAVYDRTNLIRAVIDCTYSGSRSGAPKP